MFESEHPGSRVAGGPSEGAPASETATRVVSDARAPSTGPRNDEPDADAGAPSTGPRNDEPDADAGAPSTEPRSGEPDADAEGEVDSAGDGDHEAQLEHDLEELAAKAEKADEYLELAQRTRADFENFRKRAARESAAAQERGVTRLLRELLPAVDNLDRALSAAKDAGAGEVEGAPSPDGGVATLASGIEAVHADVLAALSRVGVERFSPEGERFDPQLHEAIAQQPVEGAEPGTVVEVYQRGYRLGDAVIRPARVVVAA